MLLALICIFLCVGGLMKEHLYPRNLLHNLLAICRIRTVGIAFAGLLITMMFRKEETAGRNLMFKRNRFYGQSAIFKNHLFLTRVDRMKLHLIRQVLTMIIQPWAKQFLQVAMCIYMQRLGTPHHAECRNQTDQTEAMVTM